MFCGVSIRLQVSQKLPFQVEASARAKLCPHFRSVMGLLIGKVGGLSNAFKRRTWLDRGISCIRYPKEALLTKDPSALNTDAARKVQFRAVGADGGARGPAWKQIEEGGRA
jgi:hypothetical protein